MQEEIDLVRALDRPCSSDDGLMSTRELRVNDLFRARSDHLLPPANYGLTTQNEAEGYENKCGHVFNEKH